MSLTIGQELPTKEIHFTRDSLVRYAGASGDFNAIHYRDDVAQAVGLQGVLAHGMLTMGAAVQTVVDFLGDTGKVIDYQVRFTKPVLVDAAKGATLIVNASVVEIDDEVKQARIDLSATCDGVVVLGKAQVRVSI
jgi:acyl dehydratase